MPDYISVLCTVCVCFQRPYISPCPRSHVQDTLMDLLNAPTKGNRPGTGSMSQGQNDSVKLEIKKDPKGMVTVLGASMVQVGAALFGR